jgi:hypothetical protein
MTARQIIERRVGKPLGPVATMQPDHKIAVKRLALALLSIKRGKRTQPDVKKERAE